MSGIISSPPKCPLLLLPLELRRLIYTSVLRSDYPLCRPWTCLHPWCHPPTVVIGSRSGTAIPSLLLVSRETTSECRPIFYATNTFFIPLCCSSLGKSCPAGLQNGILSSNHLHLIRHFSFSFAETAFCEWTYCGDDAIRMCDALRRVTIDHRKPGQSLKSLTLNFPNCTSGNTIGSGVRIVASAVEELMAGGELSLTLKMGVSARQRALGDPWLNQSAIKHLVTVIGTPEGALWEQGQRCTWNHWEVWAILVPAREVAARSKELASAVGTEISMIKTFED